MSQDRDPRQDDDDQLPELQVPVLDLEEDNEALHALVSNPTLWKAFQQVASELGTTGSRRWRIDFGVGEGSMISMLPGQDGTVVFSFTEMATVESEPPTGRGLEPGGFGIFEVEEEEEGQ